MRTEQTKTGMRIPDAPPLDLAQTLDCGQCFRFEPDGTGGYRGIAGRHAALIRREGEDLFIEGTADRPVTAELFEGFWRRYLDLDRDYEAIYRSLVRRMGGKMGRCVRFSPGMRVLRQEPFEALISFILSQNNNVPRIKGIIGRLCRFGEHLGGEDYAFPTPERIACLTQEEMASLRCGWRDAYIRDAACRVADGTLDLARVAALPLEDARRELQTVQGIGPKVADCVLLYGLGRLEAFPLDVWMKRAMVSLFPDKTPADFGRYAGIAQQVIFHYCRCHPQEVRG